MRILAIRLHNIASLGGPWCIDFTAEPLKSSHLFAITGPTGAGKSALLDALCLALYASTPRLRNAPQRESSAPDIEGETLNTADPRTLLRRGESSGYAEVDFCGSDGHCYRARWSVRRARHRPGGRLQAAEQRLVSLPDGQILTAQKREFDRLVQARLGLDFEQFTRAVLLAQNEFSNFLRADDNQRSALLEKLTDTGIYSALSSAAFRRTRDYERRVAELSARLDDQAPAEEAARRTLEQQAEAGVQHLTALENRERTLSREHAWLADEKRLLNHSQAAVEAHRQALETQRASTAQRETLDALARLAPQRHLFDQREREAASLEALTSACQRLNLERTAAADEARAAQEAFDKASQALDKAQADRRHQQPLIDECARAEEQRRHRLETLSHHQKRMAELKAARAQHQSALAELDERQRTLESQLAELDERRRQRLEAAEAPGGVATQAQDGPGEWRHRLQHAQDRVRTQRQQLENRQRALLHYQQAQVRYQTLKESIRTEQAALEALERRGQAARRTLDTRRAAFETLRARLERLRLVRSESVAKLRDGLERDAPCPVCGSREHPLADRPLDTPERAMLAATEQEEQRQLDEAAHALESAEQHCATLRAEYSETRSRLEQRRGQCPSLEEERDAAAHALEASSPEPPHPASDADAPSAEAIEALHRKEAALARLIEQHDTDDRARTPLIEQRQALITRRAALESDERHAGEQIDTLSEEIAALRSACEALEAQLLHRRGDFESAAEWRATLEQTLTARADTLEACRTTLENSRQRQQQLSRELEYTEQQRHETRERLEKLTDDIQRWREAHPDIDDQRLAALRAMGQEDHRALAREIEAVDATLGRTQQQVQAREEVLEAHRQQLPATAQALPGQIEMLDGRRDEIEATLHQQQQALVPMLSEAREARDAAVHALRDDDWRRARARDIETELVARRGEWVRWGRISDLVGSADGRAFRRIAQGFNLERLIEYANVHLASLARRYRLSRGGSELGLLVIDTDMGDERRSVHSLSGGETFLVSLALALGLSSMTSSGLFIETLFIDEGFGTLDAASLAQVMDALDALQSQGRRVGVISHVQEMHERIPVQVQIAPRGSGQSALAVRRLVGGGL